MWSILFFVDQWIICTIFDPILVYLCRVVAKDNFWCARVWWKIMHGVFFIWGLYMIFFDKRALVGYGLIIVTGIVLAHASELLWRGLCSLFDKGSPRHPYDKEVSGIKYQIYVHGYNPLLLAQARSRIYVLLTMMFILPIIGYIVMPLDLGFFIWRIVMMYNCAVLIYLYIRACMIGIVSTNRVAAQ